MHGVRKWVWGSEDMGTGKKLGFDRQGVRAYVRAWRELNVGMA